MYCYSAWPGYAVFMDVYILNCSFSLVFIIGYLVEDTNAECASGTVYSVHPSLHLPFCDHIATTATTRSRVGAGLRVIGHLIQIQ